MSIFREIQSLESRIKVQQDKLNLRDNLGNVAGKLTLIDGRVYLDLDAHYIRNHTLSVELLKHWIILAEEAER